MRVDDIDQPIRELGREVEIARALDVPADGVQEPERAVGGVVLERARVDYEPGESTSGLFGGNSNWRGPIWMPINYLLVETLLVYHRYLGDTFTVECSTGSGR